MRRPLPAATLPALIALAAALFLTLVNFAFPPDGPLLKYPMAAAQYLRGELPSERIADFSPLYLALHVAVQKVGADPLVIFTVLQIAVAAAAALLLFLAVRDCTSTALALAGTAAFLLNPSVIVYTRMLEPEILLLFFLLGFAGSAVRDGARSCLTAGVFFALCLFTRPTFFPLALLLPIWFRIRAGSGNRWRAQAALFLLPLAIPAAFIVARGLWAPGKTPLLVMNPGDVFFEGNNPLANGLGLAYPPLVDDIARDVPGQSDYQHAVYRLIARSVAGHDLTVGEVNRSWSGKALAFMRDEPGLVIQRLAAKTRFFLHEYRRHDVMPAYLFDRRLRESLLPYVPFAIVSALALAGLAVLASSWKKYLPYYLVWATQLGISALVYVTDRQRVAVVPFFIFFAAAAAAWALRSRRNLVLLLAAVAPMTMALWMRNDVMTEDEHLWTVYAASARLQGEASRLKEQGDTAGAAHAAAEALAYTPWMSDWIRPSGLNFGRDGFAASALALAAALPAADFSSRLDRAILFIEAGKLDEAEPLLRRLVVEGHRFARVFDGSSRPEFYLAVIAASRGDRPGAVKRLEQALEKSPGDPFALSWLTALTGSQEHRRLLYRYFDDLDAAFLLGQASLKLGDAEAAVKAFSAVARLVPEYRRGRIYLAAALGAGGHFEQAAEMYLDAVRDRPEPALLEPEVLAIFAGLTAKHPDSTDALSWQKFVLCQYQTCTQ